MTTQTFEEAEIKSFGNRIMDLVRGKHLTREEARQMYTEVLLEKQPDLQQGAFMMILSAKGETAEEIAGSYDAIYELDTVKVHPVTPGPLVDNCGTGMDELKTCNISTAASIIAAADGVYMAKHGARAVTSTCGAVDILEALGVDVECDPDVVRHSIEKAGIGIFNGMSPKVHPQALGRILSQIRFGTTLNISGSLANPVMPAYGVRGVYAASLTETVAEVMHRIGYSRAMVFHGLNADGSKGMDEISTLGQTRISELDESGGIRTYEISPEDMGITLAREEDIMPDGSIEDEVLHFLRVLSGKDQGPRYDIICLNTAPILYLTGKVSSLKDGVVRAREIIKSGTPIAKLRQWVWEQNTAPDQGAARLESLLAQI